MCLPEARLPPPRLLRSNVDAVFRRVPPRVRYGFRGVVRVSRGTNGSLPLRKTPVSNLMAARAASSWDGSSLCPTLMKTRAAVRGACFDGGDGRRIDLRALTCLRAGSLYEPAEPTWGVLRRRRGAVCRSLSETDTEVRPWPAARRARDLYGPVREQRHQPH